MKFVLPALLGVLIAGAHLPAASAEPTPTALPTDLPAHVTLVQTTMPQKAIRKIAATHGVRLPRMFVFNARREKVLYTIGWSPDVTGRLEAALAGGKPLKGGDDFARAVKDLETAPGVPLDAASLPPADFYLIEHWGSWCTPCAVEIDRLVEILKRDTTHRFVWIGVQFENPETLGKAAR
ncbi:hypothetical protein [Tahibacter amnicola]|uniref:Uncharacterized protein n=1 Tax=Tahibacter amnicola TaxID=2976241 RepID=A0ABY6BER5_9GAMM|nr:hypothetical protein [Tahibacter amnicola]UXI68526.1 hypothetical protein N4264_02405 [Tahibacter amnicola]